MYAVYTHDNSTSQANLVADIVAILTGTTSAGSLSADCVTGSTSIDTTYATAGWTLHDASGGTNLQIIKALQQDGVTYKYVGVQATSTSSFNLVLYESWNAGTHTGTNAVTSSTVNWSSTTQHAFYIYAVQQAIVIGAYNGTSYQSPAFALECDNTLGTFISGYPTTFTFSTSNDVSIGNGPRVKNPKASGDLTTTSAYFTTSPNLDTAGSNCKGRIYRDGSETVKMALMTPLATATGSNSISDFNYGAFGKVLGRVKFGSALLSGPTTLDTVVIGSTTFILIYLENTVAQASSSIWVPKG